MQDGRRGVPVFSGKSARDRKQKQNIMIGGIFLSGQQKTTEKR
jgi:hypothetical protein